MSQVYILAEGERCEGEHVIAVYGTWDDAIAALKLPMIDPDTAMFYEEAQLKVEGDVAIVDAGDFYTIVRTKEVL